MYRVDVFVQRLTTRERFSTVTAHVGFLTRVRHHVSFQRVRICELFPTFLALQTFRRFFRLVIRIVFDDFVFAEREFQWVRFVAHVALVGFFTRVYVLMLIVQIQREKFYVAN